MFYVKSIVFFPRCLKAISKIVWGKRYAELAGQSIDGDYVHAANFNRNLPLDDKYQIIRCEFAQSNELCFEIVKRIIQIRREIGPKSNWLFVFGAILNYPELIFPNLTSRWMISVLDTIADMPCPRSYRLAAAQLRNFMLGVRLGHSMALQYVVDPAIADEPVHFFLNEEMWDGIIHVNYRYGDTYRNLFDRVSNELRAFPSLHEAFKAAIIRMTDYPPLKMAFLNNEKSREQYNEIFMKDKKDKA